MSQPSNPPRSSERERRVRFVDGQPGPTPAVTIPSYNDMSPQEVSVISRRRMAEDAERDRLEERRVREQRESLSSARVVARWMTYVTIVTCAVYWIACTALTVRGLGF